MTIPMVWSLLRLDPLPLETDDVVAEGVVTDAEAVTRSVDEFDEDDVESTVAKDGSGGDEINREAPD